MIVTRAATVIPDSFHVGLALKQRVALKTFVRICQNKERRRKKPQQLRGVGEQRVTQDGIIWQVHEHKH